MDGTRRFVIASQHPHTSPRSAVRGFVIGMLLGALPTNALAPSHRWMTGLNALGKVNALMDTLAEPHGEAKKKDAGETGAEL